ncbi:MAG TPA: MFS transporter, partial [Acidimicrobiales bacterium]
MQQGTADQSYDARRAWTTLAICCTALFMTTLDGTILNTALPALQRGLHATTAGLQWAVDGYVVVRVSSLFLCGSVGDRYGRRRTFGIGLVLFVIGSFACGLAPNMAGLIAFRCFQGLGSAVLTPASLGIITNTFVDRKRRAMAVGVWSATTGLSMGVGPVLGGFLVENFGWRSVFLVNVPIGLVALAATRTLIESKSATPRPLDFPGQLSIGGSLFLATYALISAPLVGWGSPVTVTMFAAAIVLLGAFVVVEARTTQPMLPLSVFKNRGLTGSFLLAVIAFLAFGSFLFFNTLYLQEVRGLSPLKAGLLILPTTAVALFFSPISGHLTGTRGARFPTGMATLFTAAGMGLLAVTLRATTPIYLLLIAYLLIGFGQGLINPPLTNAAVSGLPRDQAGVAGAIMTTARQIGSNLGIALVGAVIFSIATSLNNAQHVANRALQTLHGGMNYDIGVRYGDLVAGALSLLSFGIAWYAFAPRFEGTHDPETGQF